MDPDIYGSSGHQSSEVNQIKDSSGYVISDIISEFFPECNIENSVEQNFNAKFGSNDYVNNLAEKKQGIKNQMMNNNSGHNGLNGNNNLNGHNEFNGHNGINGHNGFNGQPTTDSVVPSIEELQSKNESITKTNSKLEEDLTRSQQNLSDTLKELLAAKQELFPLQEKYEVAAKENTELRDQVNYFKAQVYQLTQLANQKVKQDTELAELRKELQSKEKVIKKLKNESEQSSSKRAEVRKVKAMNKRLWNLVMDYGNSLSNARIMTEKQKKWAIRELAEFETLSDVYCEEEFKNNLQTTLNGFSCSVEDSSVPNISAQPTQPSSSHAFVNPNAKVPVASTPKHSALPWKITEEITEPNSSKTSSVDTSETTMAEKCVTLVSKPIPSNSSNEPQEDLIFSDSVDEILSELGTVRQQLSFGRCLFKPVSPIPPTPPPNKTKTLTSSKLAQSSDSSGCFRKRLNFCHQQSEGFEVQGSQTTEHSQTVNESRLSSTSQLPIKKSNFIAKYNLDGSLKCDFNAFHSITDLTVDWETYDISCIMKPVYGAEMTANVDVAENASEPAAAVHSPFVNTSSINNVLNWHAVHGRGRPSVGGAAEQRKSKQVSGDNNQTSKKIKLDKSDRSDKRQSVSGKLDEQAEAQNDVINEIEYEQTENNITSISDSFIEEKLLEKTSESAMQIQEDLRQDFDISDIEADKNMKPKRGSTKKSNLKSKACKANKSEIQMIEVGKESNFDSDFKYPIEGMSLRRSRSISPNILDCNKGSPPISLYSDDMKVMKSMPLDTPDAGKNMTLKRSESISSNNTCNSNALSIFKTDDCKIEKGEVAVEKDPISAFKSPTGNKSDRSSSILPSDAEESNDKFIHKTKIGKVKKKKVTLKKNIFSPKKGKLLRRSQLISPSTNKKEPSTEEADIKSGFDMQMLDLEKTAVKVKKENISVSRQSKRKKKANDNNASESSKECKFVEAVEEKQSDNSFDVQSSNTLSESSVNETVKEHAKENMTKRFANKSAAKFKGALPKQLDNKLTSFNSPADGMSLRKRSCSKPGVNKANASLSSGEKCNFRKVEVFVKDEESCIPNSDYLANGMPFKNKSQLLISHVNLQAQAESSSDMLRTDTTEDSKANVVCKTKKSKIEKHEVAPKIETKIETIEVSDIKSFIKSRQFISQDIPEKPTTKSIPKSNKVMKVEDMAWKEIEVSASNSHMNIKSMKRSQSISPDMVDKSNNKPARKMSLRKRSRSVISPNFKTGQSSKNELETKFLADKNIEKSLCIPPGHNVKEIEDRKTSIPHLPLSSVKTNNNVSIVPIRQTESPKKNDIPPDKISITSVTYKSRPNKIIQFGRNKPAKVVIPIENNPKTTTKYPFINFVSSESKIVGDDMKCEENISSPKKQFIKETIESPNKVQIEEQATECIETEISEPIPESNANQGILKVKELCKSSEEIVVPKTDSTIICDKESEDILSPQSPISEGSCRNEFLSPVICTEDGEHPVLAPMEIEETFNGENPIMKPNEQETTEESDFNKINNCSSEQESVLVTTPISQVVALGEEDPFSKIHLNPFKTDTFTPSGLFKPLNIIDSTKSPDKDALKSSLTETFNEGCSTSNSVLQSGATSPSPSIENNETTLVGKPQKSPSKSDNKTIFSDQSASLELINAENIDNVGNEIEVPMEISTFISNESDCYTDGELVIAESEGNETDMLTEHERENSPEQQVSVGNRQFQRSGKKKSKGKKAPNKNSKRARRASTPNKDNETKSFSTEISIPDAFKALNMMKFTDLHFNQNKHTLVNALINPKNAPTMQSAVCQIIQYLSTSKANPLLNYTLKQEESDFLPVAEKCIAAAIVFIHHKKGHRLPGILYSMIQTCFNFIIEKESFSLFGVSSLCRIMTEICKCISDKDTPLKLCSEMIKIQHKFLPYVVASMACVWKELFQDENMTKEEIYFKSCVLQAVKKKPKALPDAQWRRCNAVIKSHLQAPSLDGNIYEIVEFIYASVEEKSCNGTYDNEFLWSTILVVLTINQDWSWVKENIVNPIESKMDKFSSSEENEGAFDAFCELYADVAYFCPTDEADGYFQNYFDKHYDAESSDYNFVIDSVARSHLKYILKKRQVILPYLYKWVQDNQDKPDKLAAIKPLFERRLANESAEITEAEIPST